MNEDTEISYSDSVVYATAENQQTQIEQTATLIQQNETIIEQNQQILTFVSYMFVLLLALFVARFLNKVLSVIDGA